VRLTEEEEKNGEVAALNDALYVINRSLGCNAIHLKMDLVEMAWVHPIAGDVLRLRFSTKDCEALSKAFAELINHLKQAERT